MKHLKNRKIDQNTQTNVILLINELLVGSDDEEQYKIQTDFNNLKLLETCDVINQTLFSNFLISK